MPDETPIPIPPVPIPQPPPVDETTRQLAALGDAMRQLAESQKTLIDAVARSVPAAPTATRDVTGDPGAGGVRPAALVDYSKLTPLQQIAVGLRDAKPQGPVALRRARDPIAAAAAREHMSLAAQGAD